MRGLGPSSVRRTSLATWCPSSKWASLELASLVSVFSSGRSAKGNRNSLKVIVFISPKYFYITVKTTVLHISKRFHRPEIPFIFSSKIFRRTPFGKWELSAPDRFSMEYFRSTYIFNFFQFFSITNRRYSLFIHVKVQESDLPEWK